MTAAAGSDDYIAVLTSREAPLDARIRALYTLKEEHRDLVGVKALEGIFATTDSVLLLHEAAYNMGQFGFAESLPFLLSVLKDTQNNEVTRHEVVEAMGAVGLATDEVVAALTAHCANDESAAVRESCELALERLKLCKTAPEEVKIPTGCRFASIDPAPEYLDAAAHTTDALAKTLLDANATLWERYKAMFALRNRATGADAAEAAASVAALGKALNADTSSCLFRHEVAFVLGQLEDPLSTDDLITSLANTSEHPMVRHESAEALGAIANDKSWEAIKRYAEDPDQLVKDSCIVAIEMHNYWSKWKKPAEEDTATA